MGIPVRLLDRAAVATTTGGTGSYALGAAPSGWLDLLTAGGVSGDRLTYVVESEDRATWEECEGILTAGSPPTLSRARIIRNSSGGTSAVNWPSGTTKYITIVAVADRLPYLDTDGKLQTGQLPDSPYSILRSNATVQLGNDTAQTLTWDVNGGNTLGGIDPGASVWSAIVLGSGGLYSLRAAVSFSAGGGTYRELRIVVNSGIYAQKRQAPMSAGETVLDVAVDLGVGANSLVVVQALQNSGAALAVGGTTWTHFSAVRQI